jgi:hypothetical protein
MRMVSKQATINRLSDELKHLKEYAYDLRTRHDIAVTELAEISSGLGAKPVWYTEAHGWAVALQNKAQLAVARIAMMRLREFK